MGDWVRVDKEDGRISAVALDVVQLAARKNYPKQPGAAIQAGRFATTWAIYTRREQLTDAEVAALKVQAAATPVKTFVVVADGRRLNPARVYFWRGPLADRAAEWSEHGDQAAAHVMANWGDAVVAVRTLRHEEKWVPATLVKGVALPLVVVEDYGLPTEQTYEIG